MVKSIRIALNWVRESPHGAYLSKGPAGTHAVVELTPDGPRGEAYWTAWRRDDVVDLFFDGCTSTSEQAFESAEKAVGKILAKLAEGGIQSAQIAIDEATRKA